MQNLLPLTHTIHNLSLYWLGTDTSLKCGGAKPVLWAQTSLLAKWCGHTHFFHVRVKCQPLHIKWTSNADIWHKHISTKLDIHFFILLKIPKVINIQNKMVLYDGNLLRNKNLYSQVKDITELRFYKNSMKKVY